MGIAYIPNKKSGVVYVFDTWREFDPQKGCRVTRRKAIGKLDPVTNELIPTGSRGRPKKERPVPAEPVPEEEDLSIAALSAMMQDLATRVEALQEKMQMIQSIADELSVEEPDIGALLHSALLYDPEEDADQDEDLDAGHLYVGQERSRGNAKR